MAKNAPQRVQTGVQYVRINRAPLDSEAVMNTFSDLLNRVEKNGVSGTKAGSFYAGMYTSVVGDTDNSLNGPYYISYTETKNAGPNEMAYSYHKIVRECDLESYLSVIPNNNYSKLYIWAGTSAELQALPQRYKNVIYIVTSEQETSLPEYTG